MGRIASLLLLGILAVVLLPARASAQSIGDPAADRMGTVTFTLNGKTHTSMVKAYMVDNRLFLNGTWVEDSTVRFGRAGLASTFLLRVNGAVGRHSVSAATGADAGAFLSVLYGGTAPGRMYEILRADGRGGDGAVTLERLTDIWAEGTFEFTAYDTGNPGVTRNITGRFETEYKRIGAE